MKITVYFALISDCSSEFILEMEIDLMWSQLKALVYAVKALLADVACNWISSTVKLTDCIVLNLHFTISVEQRSLNLVDGEAIPGLILALGLDLVLYDVHINGLADDLVAVRIVVLHVVVLITLVLCCGYLGAKHLSAPARLSPGQSCHAVSCLALDNLAQDDGIFVNLTSWRW